MTVQKPGISPRLMPEVQVQPIDPKITSELSRRERNSSDTALNLTAPPPRRMESLDNHGISGQNIPIIRQDSSPTRISRSSTESGFSTYSSSVVTDPEDSDHGAHDPAVRQPTIEARNPSPNLAARIFLGLGIAAVFAGLFVLAFATAGLAAAIAIVASVVVGAVIAYKKLPARAHAEMP